MFCSNQMVIYVPVMEASGCRQNPSSHVSQWCSNSLHYLTLVLRRCISREGDLGIYAFLSIFVQISSYREEKTLDKKSYAKSQLVEMCAFVLE